MNRYDETMLATAKLFSELSYCEKKKVGALIAKDGRILATGYNGTVSGFDNQCETYSMIENKLVTSPYVIHAEQNVLMFCAKNGIPTDGTTMYITLSPCSTCAKLIVQAGVKRVVFLEYYKDLGGLEFLKLAGVELLYWEVKEQEIVDVKEILAYSEITESYLKSNKYKLIGFKFTGQYIEVNNRSKTYKFKDTK